MTLFRTVGIVIVSIFLAGCGSDIEVDSNRKPAIAEGSISPLSKIDSKSRKLIKNLAELTAEARKLESELKFEAAIEIWSEIGRLVTTKFGKDSWQARNAVESKHSAIRKSKFSATELAEFKKLKSSQDKLLLEIENGNFVDSYPIALAILRGQQILFGAQSVEVVETQLRLASVESKIGEVDQAISRFHQTIDLLKSLRFTNHPQLELAHSSLASVYAQRESWTTAISNQKEAARISGLNWGARSQNFCTQANQLGVLYHRAGNLKVAFDVLQQVKNIRFELHGDQTNSYAHSCLNLGVVAQDQKNYELAIANISEAQRVFLKNQYDHHSIIEQCNNHLATIYMLLGKADAAEDFLIEIVRNIERQPERDVEKLSTFRFRLSVALARQGKYDQAKPLLENVIQQQKTEFGVHDSRTISSLKAYALLLERTHQNDAADTIRRQIYRLASHSESNDFPRKF